MDSLIPALYLELYKEELKHGGNILEIQEKITKLNFEQESKEQILDLLICSQRLIFILEKFIIENNNDKFYQIRGIFTF